ncbi:MAG: 5-formyltetrahydrofolate cyclo-ligase [Myxococcota bacterium]
MRTPSEDALRRRVKGELRRRMKALRGALPAERREARAADAAKQALASGAFDAVANGATIGSYIAIRGELDPEPLENALRERGIAIAYPRVDEDSVVFHRCLRSELVDGPMGLFEPPSSAEVATLNALIVPALALDPRGHRVGYGMGFYDRVLAELTATRIGYAYDFQLVPETPNEAHDVALHWLVTDARHLRAEA